MNFCTTILRLGYDTALAVFKKIHGDSFTADFTFDQWAEVVDILKRQARQSTPQQSAVSDNFVVGKMIPLAKTYGQWKAVLKRRSFDSDKPEDWNGKCQTCQYMFDTISTFEEIVELHDILYDWQIHGDNYYFVNRAREIVAGLKAGLLEKAPRFAKTFNHWKWILGHSRKGELYDRCVVELSNAAQTVGEWHEVYELTKDATEEGQQRIHTRAFDMLVELIKMGG